MRLDMPLADVCVLLEYAVADPSPAATKLLKWGIDTIYPIATPEERVQIWEDIMCNSYDKHFFINHYKLDYDRKFMARFNSNNEWIITYRDIDGNTTTKSCYQIDGKFYYDADHFIPNEAILDKEFL